MSIKGLKEIQEKSAEAAELANQNRFKYLYLGDGETANIRFIDDDEVLQTKIHEYEELTPIGGIKYRKAYCINDLTGAPCKYCASGTVRRNVFVFLTYVYNIIHKVQNPELNTNPDALKWTPIKQGNQTFYKEDVNNVRILRLKWGKDFIVKNTIMQFIKTYNTLCDRDYVFARTGVKINTSYTFVPKDATSTPQEIVDAKKDLPHIDEILTNTNLQKQANNKILPDKEVSKSSSDKEVEDLF